MTVTFSFWQLAMFAGLIVLAAAVPLWLLSRLAGAVPPAVSVPGRKGGVGGLLLVTVGILVVEALASLWHFGRGLGEVIRIMLMDTSFIWPVLQTLIPDFAAAVFLITAVCALVFGRSPRALGLAFVCAWLGGPLTAVLRHLYLGIPLDVTGEPTAFCLLTVVISFYLLFSVRSALTYGTAAARRMEKDWHESALRNAGHAR